jgi:hypothetical protein
MERLLSEKANLESELGRRPEALYAARVAAEDQPSIIQTVANGKATYWSRMFAETLKALPSDLIGRHLNAPVEG